MLELYYEDTDELVSHEISDTDNTEDGMLDTIFANQIMEDLTEKDIEILIADHGEGPALAKKYDMSEEAVRTRKHWLIRKLREKYKD